MKQNERNKKMYYDLFYPYHPILGLQNGTHTFSIKRKFKRKKKRKSPSVSSKFGPVFGLVSYCVAKSSHSFT